MAQKSKKKSSPLAYLSVFCAILFAGLAVAAMALPFAKIDLGLLGSQTQSGFDYLKEDTGNIKTYLLVTVIAAAVVALLSLLRMFGIKFTKKVPFSLLIALIGIGLGVVAVLGFIEINKLTDPVFGLQLVSLGNGPLLYMLAALLSGVCCLSLIATNR